MFFHGGEGGDDEELGRRMHLTPSPGTKKDWARSAGGRSRPGGGRSPKSHLRGGACRRGVSGRGRARPAVQC